MPVTRTFLRDDDTDYLEPPQQPNRQRASDWEKHGRDTDRTWRTLAYEAHDDVQKQRLPMEV